MAAKPLACIKYLLSRNTYGDAVPAHAQEKFHGNENVFEHCKGLF